MLKSETQMTGALLAAPPVASPPFRLDAKAILEHHHGTRRIEGTKYLFRRNKTMNSTREITLALCLCLQVTAVLGQSAGPKTEKTAENAMKPPTCSLDEKALEERKNTVLKTIKAKATKTEKTKEGYVFTLPRNDENIRLVTSIILLESQCCPFFTFHISVVAGSGEIAFTIIAPSEAQSFLDELFASEK